MHPYRPSLSLDSGHGLHRSAVNDRIDYLAARTEYGNIGEATGFELASVGQARYTRRVQRSRTQRVLKVPSSELHHIADGVVQRQYAASQLALGGTLSILDFYIEGAKSISTIRHTRRGSRIRNQDRQFGSFRLQKQFHYGGMKMNTVGNNVSGNAGVGEHLADDAGFAMVKRPHSIKRMSRVACPGCNRRTCSL